MGIAATDVVPFTQANATISELAELADRVKVGAEEVMTKNGEIYVALIDAERLDYYHRLERERIHLLLIDDARRGVEDIAAGHTRAADAAIVRLQQRRARRTAPPGKSPLKRPAAEKSVAERKRRGLTASFLARLESIEVYWTRPQPTTRCSPSCVPS